MNNFTRYFLVLFLGLMYVNNTYSQIDFTKLTEEQVFIKTNKYNTWSISIGAGPVIYYTDVIDYSVLPRENYRFGTSFKVTKQFGRAWGLEAQFIMADMYGQKNNRYFKGKLNDYSLNLRFSINQLVALGPLNDKWDIYGKIGLGAVAFRSRLRRLSNDNFMKVKELYQNLGGYPNPPGWENDDYMVVGYDRDNPTKEKSKRVDILIPFGAGVKYRFNKSFDAGFELTMRNVSNDNLDANLTGADNDSYAFCEFNLTYKIGRKNKRHARWTYKNFNINYGDNKTSNPMAIRIDSLKAELDKIAGLDSIISTKTYKRFDKIIFDNNISTSVFFDFDKSDVKRSEYRRLAKVARAMKKDTTIHMLIAGHCDDRGSFKYNLMLSLKRCKSVLNTMVNDFGIDANRFKLDPLGKSELLSDTRNKSIKGIHMVNRRVDLLLLDNNKDNNTENTEQE